LSVVSWKDNKSVIIQRTTYKCKNHKRSVHEYLLERTYFVHKTHGDFRKNLITMKG
jgi:hypothetical protein